MSLRNDFIWGAATSSYQIEGAAYEDGKGLSIWDAFCKEPGRVFEGHSGDVACEHYHRYKEDVALMKEMGLKAYRFSISWPRVLPNGLGEVNEKGIKFYENLVDELLAAGITPYVTLFHWDYPKALFDKGGWLNPESSSWFEYYATVIAKRLGGKVKHYFTLNEPQCFIGISCQKTFHAPGIAYSVKDGLQMAHNVMLGHGKAVKALRAHVDGAIVGYAPTGSFFHPATDSAEDIEAARIANFDISEDWGFTVSWWSDPVILGKYPEKGVKLFGDRMPHIAPDDMATMCQPLDFYGVNIYHSAPVAADGKGGYKSVARKVGHPKTAIGWPRTPESLNHPIRQLHDRYKLPIYITENGLSTHDTVSLDGKVHDPDRIDFLNRYLLGLKAAAGAGCDILGYFQWSLMDNFEWAKGYDDRFGLIYVDFETQQRILKDSAYWYRDTIKANGANL